MNQPEMGTLLHASRLLATALFGIAGFCELGCGTGDGGGRGGAGGLPRGSSSDATSDVGAGGASPSGATGDPTQAASSSTSASSTSSGDGAGGDGCVDLCPAPDGGVFWGCKTRFLYGTNWAWRNWGADFGGVAAWGSEGVAQASASVSSDMQQMRAAGVSVIRWWMWPRLLTESIQFGEDDAPSSLEGSLVADVQKALELAEVNDVYLILTPFSFDNFFPTAVEGGILSRSLEPMVTDPARRQKLMDNLITPLAQAVESSPYRKRLIAWDMINEPEWAIAGPGLYGGEDFTPSPSLESVTHAQMETFLKEMASTLHASSGALVTIGSAAIKWSRAWSHVDVDFYQLHYYDWVYAWYPYQTVTLEAVGLTDKPVVMGEFPNQGLAAVGGHPARTAAELQADLWDQGYAGAISWAYNDGAFPWDPAALSTFAGLHPCETTF